MLIICVCVCVRLQARIYVYILYRGGKKRYRITHDFVLHGKWVYLSVHIIDSLFNSYCTFIGVRTLHVRIWFSLTHIRICVIRYFRSAAISIGSHLYHMETHPATITDAMKSFSRSRNTHDQLAIVSLSNISYLKSHLDPLSPRPRAASGVRHLNVTETI